MLTALQHTRINQGYLAYSEVVFFKNAIKTGYLVLRGTINL